MHFINNVFNAVLNHPYAKSWLESLKSVVLLFKRSNLAAGALKSWCEAAQIEGTIKDPNATRFTSVYDSAKSILKVLCIAATL